MAEPAQDALARYLAAAEQSDAPLLIAVSGGRDSVALAAGVTTLTPTRRVHLAHVHHHLRGVDADADAEFVQRLAGVLGAECSVLHVDVPAYRDRHRLSTLVAARDARYQALGCLTARLGAVAVLTAHTRDDQVETIVLNVVRGTGVRGLAGMPARTILARAAFGPPLDAECVHPWARVTIHRPLLGVSREETGEYCERRGLSYRDDPSNLDPRFRRVWVRTRMLPALRSESPLAEVALLAVSRWAAETSIALDAAVARIWQRVASPSTAKVRLDAVELAGLEDILRPYVLLEAYRVLHPGSGDLGRVHVEALGRLASAPGPRRFLHLPGGTAAVREGRWLTLGPASGEEAASPGAFDLEVPIPGEAALPDGRCIAATLRAPPEQFRFESHGAWLNVDLVPLRLRARSRRAADRYRPLGAPGSKRLKDLFIARKVPRSERSRAVVVTSDRGIAWVAGLPVSEYARVPTGARLALRMELIAPSSTARGDGGGESIGR